ncbi:MAG: HEAT repeat domain-containing protein [Deltaproteobacteria bacterium]|nr:HEAT repeat domain-containing protein [Deltaproteobacteria bacterium]
MPAKKKSPVLEGPATAKPPSLEEELTGSSKHDWAKLQRLAPLNVGPRMLYVLVDAPLLRRRLAELLEASLQKQGLPVAWLDFPQPYYQPLQEIFDQTAQHPEARFFFLFGLERSLLSAEHRMSALTDLNFHRDQISTRLSGPLIIWIPDETFTDLLINAPDFSAWRGGVFIILDEASKHEAPYRQHIIDQFGKLTLYSATADAPLAVDLEQVFVKLTATQQSHPSWARFEYLTFPREETDGIDEPSSVKWKRLENIPPLAAPTNVTVTLSSGEWKAQEDVVTTLSLTEALRRNQCLAVIGAPGSGKTTLLKYLALSFARRQARERLELTEDRLPILVYLRDFGPFLNAAPQQEDGAALLLRFLAEQYQKTAAYLNLPEDFFSRQLEAGHCIVLFDGLDEVIDPLKRSRVIDMIASLASHDRGNRFVVTSRPRGYEGDVQQRLSLLYAECTIRDFDDDDMRAFTRAWYTAVTIDRRGDTIAARETAVTQAEDLLHAIRADERVKALAHNPLLLSVLAMVHQRGVGLPQRRAELYDECTDMLLGYWDQTKGGEAGRALANLGFLNRTEKRTLLEPIALWFHERGERGLEAKKAELEEQIAAQFSAIFGDTAEKARERATVFLRVIDERAGLLVERASGVYAFAHLTFQEYLVARAIADREDYIAYTLKQLHKPWWREVLLLEVGHLSDQRYFGRRTRKLISDLLVAIRNAGSWLEDVLKRDFLFAARCLCDTGALGVDDQVRQSLMDELIALWKSTPYEPQRSQVEAIFAYAIPTRDGARICAELLSHLAGQNENTRKAAADALGRLGSAAATPAVLDRLLALSTDPEAGVRKAAAQALGRLGTAATPLVLERLLALTADPDIGVSWTATCAFGGLGSAAATAPVLDRLLALTADSEISVRMAASVAIGRLGSAAATPAVLDRLLALTTDPDIGVSWAAAWALKCLGSAAAIAAVLDRLLALTADPGTDVHGAAAWALGRLGSAATTALVLDRLLVLTADPQATVRRAAAAALGHLGSAVATASVLDRLLALTADPESDVRTSAAEALGNLGSTAATLPVLHRLLTLTTNTVANVRRAATQALGNLGVSAFTSPVLERLFVLTNDPEPIVRKATIEAFNRLGTPAATIAVLQRLAALTEDEEDAVCLRAAKALGSLGPMLEFDLLVEFWQLRLEDQQYKQVDDQYRRVCDIAYEQLQQLAELREQ